MAKKSSVKRIGQRMTSIVAKPFYSDEKIILRDYLALQRTTLANERTLFSYIRTSLYLILGGIGLSKVEIFQNLRWVGTVALISSAFIIIYGISRYIILRVKLQKFYNVIQFNEENLERIKERNKKSSENPKDDV